jgi:CHAD domain-containing protein
MADVLEPMIRTRRDPSTRTFLMKFRKHCLARHNMLMAGMHIDGARGQAMALLQRINREIDQGILLIEEHPPLDNGFEMYIRGMGRVYKQGKNLFASCLQTADDHSLHEWRKQVKYLWYHSVLLNRVWPGMMKAWAKEWQALSVMLGDHHDLVLVEAGLREQGIRSGNNREVTAVARGIRRTKTRLSRQALRAGERLFALDPRTIRQIFYSLPVKTR